MTGRISNNIKKEKNMEWFERLKEEFEQTNVRRENLRQYIDDEESGFSDINVIEQELLRTQYYQMSDYCTTMDLRIKITNANLAYEGEDNV